MSTESGFQNQKKYGEAQFKTIQPLGSDKFGTSIVPTYLYDISLNEVLVESSTIDAVNPRIVYIELASHGARLGDVLRMLAPSALASWEFDIIEIVDANIFAIYNLAESIPQVGDAFKICRWISGKADAEGNPQIAIAPSPILFVKDGVNTEVSEDALVPGNSRPLPVKLVGVTGDINITAGDLNVSTLSTNDSMALGDPITGELVQTVANTTSAAISLHVKNEDGDLIAAESRDVLVNYQETFTRIEVGNTLPLAAVSAGVENHLGELSVLKVNALRELLVTMPADTATETTLALVNDGITNLAANLPAAIGQTDSANSLPVAISSEQEAILAGIATETTLAAISAELLLKAKLTDVQPVAVRGQLIDVPYDTVITTYVGTTEKVDIVTYKMGLVTVATLTLAYDGLDRLTSVLRT